jgi:hypothetical protein
MGAPQAAPAIGASGFDGGGRRPSRQPARPGASSTGPESSPRSNQTRFPTGGVRSTPQADESSSTSIRPRPESSSGAGWRSSGISSPSSVASTLSAPPVTLTRRLHPPWPCWRALHTISLVSSTATVLSPRQPCRSISPPTSARAARGVAGVVSSHQSMSRQYPARQSPTRASVTCPPLSALRSHIGPPPRRREGAIGVGVSGASRAGARPAESTAPRERLEDP